MPIRFIFPVFIAAILTGCASKPVSMSDLVGADHGRFPDNYKEITQEYFRATLKDPYSAVYSWRTEPFKCYMRNAPVAGGRPKAFGYCGIFTLNAKNSYGGYVGEKQHRLFFKDGYVVTEFSPNPWFDEPWYR